MIELKGAQPGLTLALLGGVHGDEDEGVLAVKRVLNELAQTPMTGTIRAVAPANPVAWAAFSRTNPLDNANLARCFPGDEKGGPTSALAAAITARVIRGADFLVDLHSAGVRYAMPQFCGFVRNTSASAVSQRAAEVFGTPLIWAHASSGPGRSLSVAAEGNIPALYAECGGGGGIRSTDLDTFVNGVINVMVELSMLPQTCRRQSAAKARWVFGSGDLDDGAQSGHHGLFVAAVEAGALVEADAEIGRVYDYEGVLLESVRAPRSGIVMFLRRQGRVREADVLFVLGRLEDAAR
jgi:predicted deacylase